MFNDNAARAVATSIASHRHLDVVRVPLSPAGNGEALVYADDYDRLVRMGVGTRWFLVRNGYGQAYVRAHLRTATGGQITVARLILGLGRGACVRYYGSDRTDLRRDMIYAERGYARRDDVDLVIRQAEMDAGADAE